MLKSKKDPKVKNYEEEYNLLRLTFNHIIKENEEKFEKLVLFLFYSKFSRN